MQYIFRYEATWDVRDECSKVIKETWTKGSLGARDTHDIHNRLIHCKNDLLNWRRAVKQKEYAEKIIKFQQLVYIQNMGSGDHIDMDHKLQDEIQLKLEDEELKRK